MLVDWNNADIFPESTELHVALAVGKIRDLLIVIAVSETPIKALLIKIDNFL